MNVLVIGANGQIGSHTVRMLGLSTEHTGTAMIRKEEQRSRMQELGADEIVIGDLEKDFSHAFEHADAVIFTAGSGGHTGPEQTEVIDRKGAQKAVEEAEKAGVSRFIMISTIMADQPEEAPESIQHYLKAKGAADETLQSSGMKWTVIRPGPLSNDDARGTVTLKKQLGTFDGSIPREDVAALAVNALVLEETFNQTFEVLSGDTPLGEALKSIT
ncbi:SDR family oxidoreductase [Alkalicoccus urumqiensis]|uniref:NAD-dependent dehydratase n=1 Tax=Alkalicoccus urumqiensis TaxID=1548213 RepID=A0A2P6MEP5_ALKUR|nr:SDR family oxidoreductase [Alkalicoccus urumqiensis]PRO64720.1 NAD-dependent dehydratase [Alkalicoccus urumqiensis]